MPSIGPDDPTLHPGQIGLASPELFTRLIDDAAVFPPGNAPLDRALSEHLTHRSAWYAGLVGPLLVSAARVADLLELLAPQALPSPLQVGVIAPEGLEQARTAVHATRGARAIEVVAVELPLAAVDDLPRAWSELDAGQRAVWWEVDRAGYLREQLGRLAGAAKTAGPGGAKLRTGGADAAAFPTEAEVAAFLRHAIDVELTFKLTAGLHHAVRGTDPATGLEQHGVLNLLCATKAALNGAEEDELEGVLAERDPAPLVTRTHGMSAADASVIRAFWSSFGCCGVTDPIEELVALGLVSPATVAAR
jgi:hypothetical protein